MQLQAKADGDMETSIRRPKVNATHVLNCMKDFSQEFQRPGSNTITQHAVSEMNPIVYDVDYTVVHNPSQGTEDEGYIRKDKMTTEQRRSQRELSNVIRHGNSLANSFMKIETGLLDLCFDGRGSASFREKIAAGQRIALRIYIQNEIKRRAADLGLVKLGFCETSLIRDVAKRIVERRRTMTQAEGNVFADDIFQREFKPHAEDESGKGYIEPFLKRSQEIRNEISELIWNLQFDLTFERTMSDLFPLNYGSRAKETTTPKGTWRDADARRTFFKYLSLVCPHVGILTVDDYLSDLNWTFETNEEGTVCLRQTSPPEIGSFPAHIARTLLIDLDIITFCGARGYLPVATAASIVQGWNRVHPMTNMAIQGNLPVTQHIASTQNAYGAWEMPSGVIVAPPPKPAFDQPLAYAPPALMPGATASLTGSLPTPPPWSTGMMAGYWGHDNGTIDLSALDTQFDQFNPTSLADAGGIYMPDDAPSPPLFADF
ncbi:uncharacterized protein EAE97_007676 [Botrytis byssoidea]|uniref:Alpha box domain-containing protein n=1 Tax=Botrytis byssoidea TaxID=139641 RepID=A0A9P5ID82_9HELO|nr:uncharacterized protein EAE97_007676 [Botrytis byssoidea]KAF7937880.1 hypothetical protein EAE97_007676 [Botrytis byssoidea]